jgi:hypothetical protein
MDSEAAQTQRCFVYLLFVLFLLHDITTTMASKASAAFFQGRHYVQLYVPGILRRLILPDGQGVFWDPSFTLCMIDYKRRVLLAINREGIQELDTANESFCFGLGGSVI